MLAGDWGETAVVALFDIDSFDGGDCNGVGVVDADSRSSAFVGESGSGDLGATNGTASSEMVVLSAGLGLGVCKQTKTDRVGWRTSLPALVEAPVGFAAAAGTACTSNCDGRLANGNVLARDA